jgi:signal transduction histidine kinase
VPIVRPRVRFLAACLLATLLSIATRANDFYQRLGFKIARDLHDTLLQGVQALLFRLRIWEDDPRVSGPLRSEIAAVSEQTKSMVVEGRERILVMRRTDTHPEHLLESLKQLENADAADKPAAFTVDVLGAVMSVPVDAAEQLLDIAREAVRNAYQHSQASRISVTLEFRRRALVLSIEDDGPESGTRVELVVPARTAYHRAFQWPWQRASLQEAEQ